ncbi:hypothetical protein [Shewanella chilikensis]|uniref:hypothetical protein n=1 Tax=Shewanella chilikensis TaxID=558541 RepID=UPI003004945D
MLQSDYSIGGDSLLTFEGDFDQGEEEVKLVEFELLSYPSDVYFGDIEPDWWHEDQ